MFNGPSFPVFRDTAVDYAKGGGLFPRESQGTCGRHDHDVRYAVTKSVQKQKMEN